MMFSKLLEREHIHYTLASHCDDPIRVLVTVSGEHWEVQFLDGGPGEVERFISHSEICGEEALHGLITRYAGQERPEASKVITVRSGDMVGWKSWWSRIR